MEGHIAKYGYARVSSADQDLSSQIARLKEVGCGVIRSEKVSGKSRAGRDELSGLLDFIRDGDELVVVRLDRLGRNVRDTLNIVHALQAKGGALMVLEPSFSTRDAAGPILVTVLGMVGELERNFILDRQRVGIAAAKRRGAYKGRKPSVPTDKVRELHATGYGPSAIASSLGISRQSVYRALASAS